MSQSSLQNIGVHCSICQYPGVDVAFTSCSCKVHARCMPVYSIVSESSLAQHEKHPVYPGERMCPACNMSPLSGFRLLPMMIADLDQAVDLRKKAALERNVVQKGMDMDESMKLNFANAQAETSYLLLSHGGASGSLSTDNDYQRTGRWTDEEVTYTDFLVEAFDAGKLPIEHGMKLSDFLAEVLLCKGSRLTKKMKNAKLSIRSYEFRYPMASLDVHTLSILEGKFLQSISSEPSRLELKFNLTRLWRSHLSNLCLQVASPLIDATDWIASLEDMEKRATLAEESIRKARRKRMGLALRDDVKVGNDGVFFAGVPVHRPPKRSKSFGEPNQVRSGGASVTDASTNAQSVGSAEDSGEGDFVSDMLDINYQQPNSIDDYARILDDLVNGPGLPSSFKHMRNNCGPFLEEIISYAENHDLPFQHVDVWVPSYTKNGTNDQLRLYHAGFATRADIDGALFAQLNEYGDYSTKFSFAPGTGLPGRVFASGGTRWERSVHEASPQFFERAGGAKIYGVKTGFGFPLTTKVIGRIVVCFYSVEDIPEDLDMAAKCCTDLALLCPEPKWKLVVDMAPAGEASAPDNSKPMPSPTFGPTTSLLHYHHSPTDFSGSASAQARMDDSSVHSGSTRRSMSIDDEGLVEHRIASLLGDHMPLAELPAPGEPSSSTASPSMLVPHFMSLRLLLLRSAHRRSQEENDMIDVIRKSFNGYSRDDRRTEKDLAHLIVKDWQYLRSTARATQPKSLPKKHPSQVLRRDSSMNSYQSHVMDIPTTSTQSMDGAPVMMPRPLSFVNPADVFGSGK